MKKTSWTKEKKIDFIIILIIFITTGIISYLFSIIGMDPHHDGFMFQTALDVSKGEVLYRDIFTQYGPVTIWIQAISILLFGESIWSIKLITVLVYCLIYIILYMIAKLIVPRGIAVITCCIAIGMAPFYMYHFLAWSNVYGQLFLLLATYLMMLYIKKESMNYIYYSAIACAISFWCKQPIGAVAWLAFYVLILTLVIIKEYNNRFHKEIIIKYTLTTIGTHSLFLIILLVQGALRDWYIQCIQNAFQFVESVTQNSNINSVESVQQVSGQLQVILRPLVRLLESLFPKNESMVWSVLPIICIAYFLFGLIVFRKKKLNTETILAMCLSIYSIASWNQYYPATCVQHTFWSALPMFILVVYIVWKVSLTISGKLRGSIVVAILLFILILGSIFGKDISLRVVIGESKLWKSLNIYEEYKEDYLLRLRFLPEESYFYSEFEEQIQKLEMEFPDKEILNISDEYYFTCFEKSNMFKFFKSKGNVYYNLNEMKANYINEQKPIIIAYDDWENAEYKKLEKAADNTFAPLGIHGIRGIDIFIPINLTNVVE